MELLLFRHEEFDKLYGCDGFNSDKIPLEERTNIVNGCILITLFFVFELNMFVNALATGILGIIGAVYCDYPLLIYTTGALVLCNKLRCLFALPICYGFAVAMFTETPLFSGIYLSWFFNPYVGYTDEFGKNTFLQVIFISMFNLIAAVIYISIQYVSISKIYIIIGAYAWVFTSGCPPLVYLLLNKRIRNDCANFGRAIFRFLRKDNNSVPNGPIVLARMAPNYAGNNANNRNTNNNNVLQQC
ncbi:hypothetical protein niasHT_038381 [Heterodera trifolii]|uniref:Uncharacterized protein n=1 Tax=Heterodera trifolii TaxID=157864 RepID=A0ABD2IS46_9BILA